MHTPVMQLRYFIMILQKYIFFNDFIYKESAQASSVLVIKKKYQGRSSSARSITIQPLPKKKNMYKLCMGIEVKRMELNQKKEIILYHHHK